MELDHLAINEQTSVALQVMVTKFNIMRFQTLKIGIYMLT